MRFRQSRHRRGFPRGPFCGSSKGSGAFPRLRYRAAPARHPLSVEARLWIARRAVVFRRQTASLRETGLWMMANMGRILVMGFPSPAADAEQRLSVNSDLQCWS